MKSRPCATLQNDNSFAVLDVDADVSVDVENRVKVDQSLTCKDACTSVVAPAKCVGV
jgi:hypothetical protein